MKHQSIYNRLRRIEGQIRGIEEMIAKERAPEDILIQLEAARSSLASTITSLIEDIIKDSRGAEGKFSLDEKQVQTLSRLIKRS